MWKHQHDGGSASTVVAERRGNGNIRRVGAVRPRRVSDRIRRSLDSLASRSDALIRLRRIVAGSITRPAYVKLLHQLYPVQLLIERAASSVELSTRLFNERDMSRASIVSRDMECLAGTTSGVILPATSDLLRRLSQKFEECPASVMGAVYVIESARLGAPTLARAVSRALGLPVRYGRGLDFLLDGVGSTSRRLATMRNNLDAWCEMLGLGSDVLDAARLTAEGLCCILCNATEPVPCSAAIRGASRVSA